MSFLPPVLPSRSRRTLRRRRLGLRLEELESRTLLSAYTPAQIRHAYGFDQVTFSPAAIPGDGRGQAIAIVTAYDDPSIYADLQTFDAKYGVPDPVTFSKLTPQGLPAVNKAWAQEMALDVEWAHAIAPAAGIILVEAKTSDLGALLGAVDYAKNLNVQVISMSWGTAEFPTEVSSGYDGHFLGAPHTTFLAASGDTGAPPTWPAISPNVVAVGGTTLNAGIDGTWLSETGWGAGAYSWLYGGSGGGISKYEAKPDYQSGVTQSRTMRTNPDVAYNANPTRGFSVYDSQNRGWTTLGGTSAGAPQWAALVAIADQGRAMFNLGPLGTHDTLTAIYSVSAGDFHDIVGGSNGYLATAGYDLVTGRGSPKADLLVPDLVNAASLYVGTPPPSSSMPGSPSGQPASRPDPHPVRRLVVVDTVDPAAATTVVVLAQAQSAASLPSVDPGLATLVLIKGSGTGAVSVTAGVNRTPTVFLQVSPPLAPPAPTTASRIESGSSTDDDHLLAPERTPGVSPELTPMPDLTPISAPPILPGQATDRLGAEEDWQAVDRATPPQAVRLSGDETGWRQEAVAGAVAFALLFAGFRPPRSDDDDESDR
jgi:hypothetical protein